MYLNYLTSIQQVPQGPVPQKMVKVNPGLSHILSKVFLSYWISANRPFRNRARLSSGKRSILDHLVRGSKPTVFCIFFFLSN